MSAPLLSQSTIYRRHHARLMRTYALKDDPRPALIRVLSGLPLCRLAFPPYQPSLTESAALQLPQFADETIYASDRNQPEIDTSASSVAPVVLLAAALSGGAAEYVFGWRAASLPRSWLSSLTGSAAATRPSIQASHDSLTMHHQQVTQTGKSKPGFDLPIRRQAIASHQVLLAAGVSALLFGTRTFASEKLTGEYSSVSSSAIAGAVVATVTAPLQTVRSRMALQKASGVVSSTAALSSTAASLFRTRGLASMFHGARIIYGREIAGAILYFGSYDAVKNAMEPEAASRGEVSSPTVVCAGASAGVLYRGFAHCIDTVFTTNPPGMGMMRGVTSTLLRAAPASAVLFLGYEAALSSMR